MMEVRGERRGAVALLTLGHPPVNALCLPMRQALWTALEQADADAAVHAIVIAGAGRGFCGGGDLREMRTPLQQAWPGISNHLLPRIEACRKPVIAALHGFAVGGGLELALACHLRVAQRDARVALPEIKHGVIPPSGSQRLPRAVGVDRALALMLRADHVPAEHFAGTPLFDRLCDSDVVGAALALAAEREWSTPPSAMLLRHRPLALAEGDAAIAVWRKRLGAPAPANVATRACVDAVEFALHARDFDAGLLAAKQLHDRLAAARDFAGACA